MGFLADVVMDAQPRPTAAAVQPSDSPGPAEPVERESLEVNAEAAPAAAEVAAVSENPGTARTAPALPERREAARAGAARSIGPIELPARTEEMPPVSPGPSAVPPHDGLMAPGPRPSRPAEKAEPPGIPASAEDPYAGAGPASASLPAHGRPRFPSPGAPRGEDRRDAPSRPDGAPLMRHPTSPEEPAHVDSRSASLRVGEGPIRPTPRTSGEEEPSPRPEPRRTDPPPESGRRVPEPSPAQAPREPAEPPIDAIRVAPLSDPAWPAVSTALAPPSMVGRAPASSQPPPRSEPDLHIGRIDVVVASPAPPARSAPKPSATATPSRRYLRTV